MTMQCDQLTTSPGIEDATIHANESKPSIICRHGHTAGLIVHVWCVDLTLRMSGHASLTKSHFEDECFFFYERSFIDLTQLCQGITITPRALLVSDYTIHGY
jgi:hypothetical protein